MLWPLALFLTPVRFLPASLVVVIAINVIVGAGWVDIEAPKVGPLVLALPNASYAPILMGALLAILLNSKSGYERFAGFLGRPLATPVMVVVLVAVLQCCSVAVLQWTPANVLGLPNLLIHSTMTMLLAALVIQPTSILSGFLQSPLVRRVGTISYGVYLYHLIGLDFTNRLLAKLGMDNLWVLLFAYSVVSCIIAEISYRTLEAYFRRFRPKN